MNAYNQSWDKALSQKLSHYKAVCKRVAANNKGAITTLVAMGVMCFAPEALAAGGQGVTSEINFASLGDEALDSIKNGGAQAVKVLGIGVTIVGGFKGYQYLKSGIRRA